MDLLTYWLFGGQLGIPFPVINIAFIQTKEENLMTKFRNSDKATKKEVREALMSLAAESTPNRFNVKFDSDGSGACVVLMVERDAGEDCNGKSPFLAGQRCRLNIWGGGLFLCTFQTNILMYFMTLMVIIK